MFVAVGSPSSLTHSLASFSSFELIRAYSRFFHSFFHCHCFCAIVRRRSIQKRPTRWKQISKTGIVSASSFFFSRFFRSSFSTLLLSIFERHLFSSCFIMLSSFYHFPKPFNNISLLLYCFFSVCVFSLSIFVSLFSRTFPGGLKNSKKET